MKLHRLTFVLILALSSCGPRPSEPNLYQKNSFYPQDFKTSVTALIQERNGQPFVTASAFLIQKENGLFITAKHFVEDIGQGDFKIFLNGRVYDGLVVATPAIADLAEISIKGNFNPEDLPEPLPLAEDSLAVGECVIVQGVHLHPFKWQYGKQLAWISQAYYDMSWVEKEFVFDNLPACITNLHLEVKNKDIEGTPKGFEFVSNTFIEVNTVEDHLFSFGGLSGGPVVDSHGKVIGIVTAGGTGGDILEGFRVIYKPWKIIWITPVVEIRKLLSK